MFLNFQHDFCWEDHGHYSIAHYYSEEAARLLDDKFNITTNLTYMTIGDYTSVDTSVFRRAVQCYSQCLVGVRHDDYDYSEINHLLPRYYTLEMFLVCLHLDSSVQGTVS